MKNNCPGCGKYLNLDRCHIKSEKSGGTDDDWNILPMCRLCHIEQHKQGWHRFSSYRVFVSKELEDKGWTFEKHGCDNTKVWKLRRKV